MSSITNKTREAVTLPTGHTVARGAGLETTNAVLRSPDNIRRLATLIAAGMVTVEYDPDPVEDAPEATSSVIDAPDRKPSPQIPLTPTAWATAPADKPKEA
ncbi:hypothetical protein E4191_07610 [Paracoccus liaowanqingii]|uniref:Uncharacterized protein n=1 Tax=Paracoccus liaowanqingii TaxID=2560053 RepID=A0A4P7HN42_9RHOB|nr:hypothetical protein [Paracoccus liaowanqingii]QBX34591.1 hypothetical protein E4191_07610 [Paracoccus liaowanqingii]